MNRRGFIKSVVALAAATQLPKLQAAEVMEEVGAFNFITSTDTITVAADYGLHVGDLIWINAGRRCGKTCLVTEVLSDRVSVIRDENKSPEPKQIVIDKKKFLAESRPGFRRFK